MHFLTSFLPFETKATSSVTEQGETPPLTEDYLLTPCGHYLTTAEAKTLFSENEVARCPCQECKQPITKAILVQSLTATPLIRKALLQDAKTTSEPITIRNVHSHHHAEELWRFTTNYRDKHRIGLLEQLVRGLHLKTPAPVANFNAETELKLVQTRKAALLQQLAAIKLLPPNTPAYNAKLKHINNEITRLSNDIKIWQTILDLRFKRHLAQLVPPGAWERAEQQLRGSEDYQEISTFHKKTIVFDNHIYYFRKINNVVYAIIDHPAFTQSNQDADEVNFYVCKDPQKESKDANTDVSFNVYVGKRGLRGGAVVSHGTETKVVSITSAWDDETKLSSQVGLLHEAKNIRGSAFCLQHFCGEELARVIDRGLDSKQGVALASQLATEVVQLHENMHIIHRDLKPKNVTVDNGRLRLIDFGVSKSIASKTVFTQEDSPATPINDNHHRDPQAGITGQYSTKSDWYSVGQVYKPLLAKHPMLKHVGGLMTIPEGCGFIHSDKYMITLMGNRNTYIYITPKPENGKAAPARLLYIDLEGREHDLSNSLRSRSGSDSAVFLSRTLSSLAGKDSKLPYQARLLSRIEVETITRNTGHTPPAIGTRLPHKYAQIALLTAQYKDNEPQLETKILEAKIAPLEMTTPITAAQAKAITALVIASESPEHMVTEINIQKLIACTQLAKALATAGDYLLSIPETSWGQWRHSSGIADSKRYIRNLITMTMVNESNINAETINFMNGRNGYSTSSRATEPTSRFTLFNNNGLINKPVTSTPSATTSPPTAPAAAPRRRASVS